jgi:hypothetical protein
MSRRPTAPMRPGWNPLGPAYPRRRGAGLARWWWPALVTVAFLALAGWVLGHDQAAGRAGLSIRGLLTLGLALVAIVVLTIRRRRGGPRALLASLAQYAVIGALVLALVGLSTPAAPAGKPTREPARRRPQPVQVDAADRPTNPLEWMAEQWRRAGELADRNQPHAAHSPTAEEASP